MNELKEIADRLNGYDEKNRYIIVCATHDDENKTWSLKVRHIVQDETQGAQNESD